MGCGANKGRLAKVIQPSARSTNTRLATTHQTHVSDSKIQSKVPKDLNPPVGEEKSELSVEVTAAPREGRGAGVRITEPQTAPVAPTVVSPRSASLFNVVCWCKDEAVLRRIAEDPTIEYTPEDSSQTLTFYRLSALSQKLSPNTQIAAIVYLVSDASDFPAVKAVSEQYASVWNHFIVAPEDLPIPVDFVMPHLTSSDSLQKAIHDAYLDLISIIDGFMVSSKSATMLSISKTVHLEIKELMDIAGGVDTSQRLKPLREHWRKGRAALWRERKKLREAMGGAGKKLQIALQAAAEFLSRRTERCQGDVSVAFGDPKGLPGCYLALNLSTASSLGIKPSDRDCYISIFLTPKPSSVPFLANSRLSTIAQQTLDAVFQQEPRLKDLFGYEIMFSEGKLEFSLWFDPRHPIARENVAIQAILAALHRLETEEIALEYKNDRKVSDFLCKKDSKVLNLLLDGASFAAKWSLSLDIWSLFQEILGSFCVSYPVSVLFDSVKLDISCESPSNLQLFGVCFGQLLEDFREHVREPLEVAPSVYQQLKNLLDFYECRVEAQGKVRNVNVTACASLPDLVHALRHNKKFPFL